ncbi:MAG: hypothetical protein PWP23_2274 [Candidatus Sumerlaeota bacterium]|nr:hypothetical protein [Candidatus Sumerlaeota bacterium]
MQRIHTTLKHGDLEAGSPGGSSGAPYRRIVVALIHPSNYDQTEAGGTGTFVQTYHRGVLPSNTLRLLGSLTREALAHSDFADMATEVHAFDDAIRREQRAYRRLESRFPEKGTLFVVGLVGVQSNQFPRARDLMDSARAHGAITVIGGPHITASINTMLHGISAIDPMRPGVPCPRQMPPEIAELLETPGMIVFHGDADASQAWGRVLREIAAGTAVNYYEAGLAHEIDDPGDVYAARHLDAFASPVAAVDTERGCPFKCKFCAAIQAHGREVRCRSPHGIVSWVRRQCTSYGKPLTVLFASDNLARNPYWRETLAGLRELRAEGYDFTIWAEADVLCDSGPNRGFLEAYAAAGGRGLFLGIESMNPANIAAAGKKQNDVAQLPAFFAKCRRLGIAPEGGYIIGFEHDTPESIVADVQKLAESGLARAWFFIKTLLPGSQDWVEALDSGRRMSDDLNRFDSTVVSAAHENMTDAQWRKAYDSAIQTFYSVRNMIRVLSDYADPAQRWRLIKGFMWCRWAYLTERSHPMIAGFYRYCPYRERRRGTAPLSPLRYAVSEVRRHLRYVGCFLHEFYLFQQVILETEVRLRGADQLAYWQSRPSSVRDWMRRTFTGPMCRAWLNEFWVRYGSHKWRLLSPISIRWHVRMLLYAFSEVVYTVRFIPFFLRGLRTTP